MTATQTTPKLPPEFSDLEAYAEWALPTEGERYDKRESSSIEDLQSFYDAMLSRVEAALNYLDGIPLDSLPDDARRLLLMIFSFATISFSVEIWKQGKVPDTGISKIHSLEEPLPI